MSEKDDDNKESQKVIMETVAEYTVDERVNESVAANRPLPHYRPLEDYSDAELEALYSETAEEDARIAEEGLEEYAQHLREIDRS